MFCLPFLLFVLGYRRRRYRHNRGRPGLEGLWSIFGTCFVFLYWTSVAPLTCIRLRCHLNYEPSSVLYPIHNRKKNHPKIERCSGPTHGTSDYTPQTRLTLISPQSRPLPLTNTGSSNQFIYNSYYSRSKNNNLFLQSLYFLGLILIPRLNFSFDRHLNRYNSGYTSINMLLYGIETEVLYHLCRCKLSLLMWIQVENQNVMVKVVYPWYLETLLPTKVSILSLLYCTRTLSNDTISFFQQFQTFPCVIFLCLLLNFSQGDKFRSS